MGPLVGPVRELVVGLGEGEEVELHYRVYDLCVTRERENVCVCVCVCNVRLWAIVPVWGYASVRVWEGVCVSEYAEGVVGPLVGPVRELVVGLGESEEVELHNRANHLCVNRLRG